MADERRALLTDAEREILSGERDVNQNYRYKVESTVRTRFKRHLASDVEALQEGFPEGVEILRSEVCEE